MNKSKARSIQITASFFFIDIAKNVVEPIIQSKHSSTGIPPGFDIANYSLESVDFVSKSEQLSAVECQMKVSPELSKFNSQFYPSPLTIPVDAKHVQAKFMEWLEEDMDLEKGLYKLEDIIQKWSNVKMTMVIAESEKEKTLVTALYPYKKTKNAGQVVNMETTVHVPAVNG